MSFHSLAIAMDRAARTDDDGRSPCLRCTHPTADPLGVCGRCRGAELAERRDALRGRHGITVTRRERDGS